jgi:hypothetical protein
MLVSARAHRHVGDLLAAVAPERLRVALRAVTPGSAPEGWAPQGLAPQGLAPQGFKLQGSPPAGLDRHTGWTAWAEEDRPAGHDVVLAVVEEARRAGGPVAAAQALALAHHRLLRPGLSELRCRVAEDLIAEGSRTLRHSDTLTGLLWRAVDFILDGDARAARCLTELRGLLAVRDQPTVRFVLQAIEVMLEVRAGRFEQAELRAADCAALGAEVGDVDAAAWHASHLIAIRWYQGRIAELVPLIRRIAAAPSLSPADHSYQSAPAVAAAAAGNRGEALEALAAACDRGLHRVPRSGSWLVAMYGIVEAAYLLGEREIAEQACRLLVPYAALPAAAGPAVSCFGSVEHALGLAWLTLGDPGKAAAHLRRAVAHNTALGHFPAAVLARHRLAAALARSPRLHAQARSQARTARRDAGELGMALPGAPGTVTPGTVTPGTVTPGTVTPGTAARAARQAAVAVPAASYVPASTAMPPIAVSCRRQGRHWQIQAAGRTVLLDHCRGLAYLAVLFANPGNEIPALELATGPNPTAYAQGTVAEISRAPAVQPLLDEQALWQYRHRIKGLQQVIEDCQARGDRARAAQARTECDWLRAQLRSASGLTGRMRSFPTTEERARVAVGKAIRRALARIAEADHELGLLLAAGIRTGRRCSYAPTAP